MKYRRLDENYDYVFGQNEQDFVSDVEAVKQALYTRLKLLYGEWWEDTEDGFPFLQQIAAQAGTPENLQTADLLITDRIVNTEGVLNISEYNSEFDGEVRSFSVYTKVNSIYGEFDLEVSF